MHRIAHRLPFTCVLFVVLSSASTPFACATSAATTTTLTVSSGGSAVTTVTSGSGVTLTAAVTSNSAKVTVGQVNFCDASVTYCTDIHLLGTAQLTSAGTAVLKLAPWVGSHSYKAVFLGTKTVATSTSATSSLTVTGLFPSVTTLTSTGQAGALSLTTYVIGNGTAPPTGTISYLDAGFNNQVLGTAALGAGQAGPQFIATSALVDPVDQGYTDGPNAYVVGDFNGDGFLDIAETVPGMPIGQYGSIPAHEIVMLGDGAGDFTPAASLTLQAHFDQAETGDFNGDGILDLALFGLGTNQITILLGKGDGTFTQGQTFTAGAQGDNIPAFFVADLNGDGIDDMAFFDATTSLLLVFLGNGDGTFTASLLPPSSLGSAKGPAFAVGDFNGDGIPDLALGSIQDAGSAVTILQGNGDGTFTATGTFPISGGASIVAGDFNGDGNLDLATGGGGGMGGTVTILLGDGHGSFSPAPGSPYGTYPNITTTFPAYFGDFNGDDKLDLMIQGQIFLGNGDGTFTADPNSGPGESPNAVGDFNGDGLTDLVSSSGVSLAAMQLAATDINGFAGKPGAGPQMVVASYPGDSNYKASTSPATSLPSGTIASTVTVTASATSPVQGLPVVLTATVTSSGIAPTGQVTLYAGSAVLGTATLNSSSSATLTTSTLALGASSIIVRYAGDTNNAQSTSAVLVVTVTAPGSTASTVTVKPAATTVAAGQPLTVSITVSGAAGGATPSGSVNLATGSYSTWQPLSSGTASFTLPAGTLSSGANTLTASYPGDPVYAAGTATATVTVPPVLVTIPAPPSVAPGGSTTATATFSAGTTYQGTLNLTCALTTSPTGAQSLPTCTMNPTSVAIATGGTGTSVLTVKTIAASTASLRKPSPGNFWRIGGGGTVLALLLTCGISSRRRRWISMLALLAVFSVVVTIGCGGGSSTKGSTGSPGTTAGNYVFTVTGTDASNASIAATTTVTVTVQ
ncbi:MAG: FG-GAP-like repeat-containing protein [Terracidiphilus sp.]|jgi:hypothetical protein